MIFFKRYRSINGFPSRFTIIKIKNFSIRIHGIKSEDKTTLYHTHPFDYISIVLWGGYKERLKDVGVIEHNLFSVIKRNHNDYHKILSVKPNTYTLFISYGKYEWTAVDENNKWYDDCGIYKRIVNGRLVFSKKKGGVWYIGNSRASAAKKESRASIYQTVEPIELIFKI
jgi:hypothetical protein